MEQHSETHFFFFFVVFVVVIVLFFTFFVFFVFFIFFVFFFVFFIFFVFFFFAFVFLPSFHLYSSHVRLLCWLHPLLPLWPSCAVKQERERVSERKEVTGQFTSTISMLVTTEGPNTAREQGCNNHGDLETDSQ